jgi:hypothetical protein
MEEPESLQGWEPEIGPELPLARVIDLAFDYRGNLTVVKTDGAEVYGYLFNRDAGAPEPFIQVLDGDGERPITIPYTEIRTIRFTGKDMAAGNSYAAWLRRKEHGKPAQAAQAAGGA